VERQHPHVHSALPAVGDDRRAGDERRVVGRQEQVDRWIDPWDVNVVRPTDG
jgi:hypothetical protein